MLEVRSTVGHSTMRRSLTTTCFLLAGMTVIGCRQAAVPTSTEVPAIQELASPQESTEVDLAMLRYHTGDVKKWPDYQFQLEYSFDIPEVPPEIVGPFSAADIPAED